MQIEEGKFYRTRDGQKVGPMCIRWPDDKDGDRWGGLGDMRLWKDSGEHWKNRPDDLIAEWTDTPEPAKAGLPDVMVFIDDASDKMDIEVESGLVQIMARSGGDEAMMLFTPERARAIAAALMAYADQAEGST